MVCSSSFVFDLGRSTSWLVLLFRLYRLSELAIAMVNVNWRVGISYIINSIQILLDATQNQKRVYQAQSVSALVNSVAIWLLISLGAGLYTIPLALIASTTVFMCCYRPL